MIWFLNEQEEDDEEEKKTKITPKIRTGENASEKLFEACLDLRYENEQAEH